MPANFWEVAVCRLMGTRLSAAGARLAADAQCHRTAGRNTVVGYNLSTEISRGAQAPQPSLDFCTPPIQN
jgi:hypothetical protein